MGTQKYESDIILGELYRHDRTGIEGHATYITFFETACERVSLQVHADNGGDLIQDYAFDANQLTHVQSRKKAESPRPGGARPMGAPRPSGARR